MLELLNIKEAAEELRVSEFTIRHWIEQERFPIVRMGRQILIKKSDLIEFVNKNTKPAREIGNAKS